MFQRNGHKNQECYTLQWMFNIVLHILAGYFLCLLRLTRDLETQKEVQHLCGESNQLLLSCRALYCRRQVRTNEANEPAAFGGNMKLAVNSIRNLVSYLKLQQSWVNCHSLSCRAAVSVMVGFTNYSTAGRKTKKRPSSSSPLFWCDIYDFSCWIASCCRLMLLRCIETMTLHIPWLHTFCTLGTKVF